MAQCRRFLSLLHLFLRVAHNFHQLFKEIAQVHTLRTEKHLTQRMSLSFASNTYIDSSENICLFFAVVVWRCSNAALPSSHSYRLIVFFACV